MLNTIHNLRYYQRVYDRQRSGIPTTFVVFLRARLAPPAALSPNLFMAAAVAGGMDHLPIEVLTQEFLQC